MSTRPSSWHPSRNGRARSADVKRLRSPPPHWHWRHRAQRGAVHLDYDPGADGTIPTADAVRVIDPAGAAASLERARQLIAASHTPVVIVGFEAVDDAVVIRAALERLGCPVLTTYQAAGLLPEGHPQLAGLYTSGAIERPLLDAADLVITVGLDTVEPMPPAWASGAPVITLTDVDPASTFVPAAVTVRNGVGASLSQLIDGMSPADGWAPDAGANALGVARATLQAASAGSFGPLELTAAVARRAPRNAIATVDAGAHFLAVMPFWPAAAPLELLISNGLATMGFAVPAAIGAALARPGRPVICMVGDGGLGMTLAELETIARLALPITTVVFDDATLSLIAIKQRPGQGGDAAVRYRSVDFAAIATAMGIESAVADSAADVERLIDGDWTRPRLIDARIDPATYPALIAATRG